MYVSYIKFYHLEICCFDHLRLSPTSSVVAQHKDY